MLRIGAEYSDAGKAGVFYNTTAAETTDASHGAATEYCGRVIEMQSGVANPQFCLSTGLADYYYNGYRSVDASCLSFQNVNFQSAFCHHHDFDRKGVCPLGWDTYETYASYQPGCHFGSYYPNPRPALPTNIYTGSLYSDKCLEPYLINENLCQ